MAIEFKHNGRTWRADTLEEAIALRQELESSDNLSGILGREPDTGDVWTHDNFVELVQNAGENQLELIHFLFQQAEPPTSHDIVKHLKLDSEVALAGVLSGLSKQLKRMGLKPSNLYSVDVSWSGKDKTRTFKLLGQFKEIANELGWPEGWSKKKR